jgi:primosomal protein N' (replication factor Y)
MSGPEILQVALPVPLPQLFDYLPSNDSPVAPEGSRVLVPFGSRSLLGVVVRKTERSEVPASRLLRVTRVLDGGEPLLERQLIGLLRWCWNYYKHAPGEVLLSALPPSHFRIRRCNSA